MLLTGTHGKKGVSGLTDKHLLDRKFYEADCKRKSELILYFPNLYAVGVGVVPRAKSSEIPDIMEIQRAELSEDQDCFYNDSDINQMRIQVRSQVWRLGLIS